MKARATVLHSLLPASPSILIIEQVQVPMSSILAEIYYHLTFGDLVDTAQSTNTTNKMFSRGNSKGRVRTTEGIRQATDLQCNVFDYQLSS